MRIRHFRRLALALAFGVLPVAACGGDANDDVADSPQITPAPAGEALRVTDVELGRSLDADGSIADDASTDDFSPNETIYASVATEGGSSGTLVARWSFEDGQVVDEVSRTVTAGAHITEFHISKPDGFPEGNYKLEILLDGRVVETEEFEVAN